MKRQDKENNLINNLEGLNKVILSSDRFENENQAGAGLEPSPAPAKILKITFFCISEKKLPD